MFEGFETGQASLRGTSIAYVRAGHGAPVLLLHGFPQTHAMWADIAPQLVAAGRQVICADLRGYGDSGKPQGMAAYSFREMGADMAVLMQHLGFARFDLVGHDRGGRTAHRMALDHPEAVASLTVMDIVPTQTILDALTTPVARAYYHWLFLAQPAPFPETMIGHDPDAYFESCLLGWGAAQLSDFGPAQLQAYRHAWRNPQAIAAMCNDYRAAIDVDLALDRADLDRQVHCPALVLYGAQGAMAQAYDVAATWAPRLADMRAAGITGGHFFPDQSPGETATALLEFFASIDRRAGS
jgi:haloacetate dehalogenase